MIYVQVRVAEPRYQKQEPLTYRFTKELTGGNVVIVPYGKKMVLGFVTGTTASKPKFAVKEVAAVLDTTIIPRHLIELENWMQAYYPGGGSVTQLFLPSGLEKARKVFVPPPVVESPKPPVLTAEQRAALSSIRSATGSVLIHGETGSGKSRLYLEVIKDALKVGTSALVLVPEISLVPQMQHYLETYFGARVVPIHSGLTKATRNKNWHRIQSAEEPVVVVGARSALFSPVKSLGAIIIDEMHEPAYKQDASPYYNSLRVVAQLARLCRSKLLYGSATPPVTEYYLAEQLGSLIVNMKQSALPTKKTKVSIIDMTKSENLSRFSGFSRKLLDSIKYQLDKNQQSLIFLNRRGTARQILCTSCGWQALCPNCDTALIYHGDKHVIRCHTCGHQNSPPYSCPQCGEQEVTYRSLGTKALAESLQNIFPEATIQRFDTDNKVSEKLDKHFASIKAGNVDILVGTQMLGKGLDLPKLGLVGITSADTGLSLPDFSASERSYQLLHQAIGRVGRGHVEGEVIIQTYNPSNPVLQAAINRDWSALYERELAERKVFTFPPFCFLLKLTISRKSSDAAERYAKKLHQQIARLKLPVQASQPVPSFYLKSFGKYNWQLVIKSKDRKALTRLISSLPAGDWTYDIDPNNLL